MKKYLLLYLFLFPLIVFARGSYSDIWRTANDFYSQKQYDSAVSYYEKLATLQPDDPEVYYNLGNAYYKLNRVGPAVLYYQRALRVDPSFQPAKDNLYLAESRIQNRIQGSSDIFFIRWWKNMTNPSMENNWAIVAIVLFLVCLVVLALRRMNKVALPSQVALLAGLLCLLSLVLSYVSADKFVSHPQAVVMTADAPMRENLKSSKTSALIPEGTVISVEGEQGNWMEVKLPDGRAGYMEKDDLQKI
jgi:tetratricopeptide (TPR) repeat protein